MKMLTEMADRMNGNGKHPVYNEGGIRPERAFARDVSAAHALMQAVDELTLVDRAWIENRAEEIMREWKAEVGSHD